MLDVGVGESEFRGLSFLHQEEDHIEDIGRRVVSREIGRFVGRGGSRGMKL